MSARAASLNHLLANYQVHYQKMRNFHWNVRGPMFFDLHIKFEELYTAAALKVDALAERVRALGAKPLSTLQEQLAAASLEEEHGELDANAMVAGTLTDLDALNAELRAASKQAGAADDDATVNLLDPFADEQEQTAGMLRAWRG